MRSASLNRPLRPTARLSSFSQLELPWPRQSRSSCSFIQAVHAAQPVGPLVDAQPDAGQRGVGLAHPVDVRAAARSVAQTLGTGHRADERRVLQDAVAAHLAAEERTLDQAFHQGQRLHGGVTQRPLHGDLRNVHGEKSPIRLSTQSSIWPCASRPGGFRLTRRPGRLPVLGAPLAA